MIGHFDEVKPGFKVPFYFVELWDLIDDDLKVLLRSGVLEVLHVEINLGLVAIEFGNTAAPREMTAGKVGDKFNPLPWGCP